MKKVVMLFVIIMGFLTVTGFDEKNIIDYISQSDSINILSNGNESQYLSSSAEYDEILSEFLKMCQEGYEMPAFGVSINESKKDFCNKFCMEFVFNNTIEHLGMDFNSLLIEIDESYCGFNIRRGINGVYNGRNYYYNLNKTMGDFAKFLLEKTVQIKK